MAVPLWVLRGALLLTIGVSLQGCVGVGAWVFWPRTVSITDPQPLYDRGAFRTTPEDLREIITASPELRQHWGDPDNILQHDEHTEEWTYTQPSWQWHGVLVYVVVVPLPLLLPVGSEYVSLTLKDGQLTAATRVTSDVVASGYCGFFIAVQSGMGCGTGTFERH